MDSLANLIGQSAGILAIKAELHRLLSPGANTRRLPPVLLRGETGTGKGLLARSLHAASPRASGPLVSVNCAAIPESLLEAELFGFERGAFTDARQAKRGLFQEADGGTLFLDEAGLLPETLQAKLLTALDERAVRRLGRTRPEAIDCWIIAATSADLERARAEGRFREDLYHRLSVFTIWLPPLRERGDDIQALADALLTRTCSDYGLPARTLDDRARAALTSYSWPGNVRELANVLERAALLSESPVISTEGLGLPPNENSGPERPLADVRPEHRPADLRGSLDALEHLQLVDALERAHWNVAQAAELLGIPRNTLRYRVEKHGLAKPPGLVVRRRSSSVTQPPAVTVPRGTTAQPLRWETRTAIWLRVTIVANSPSEASRLLGLFASKVAAFGGDVLQQTPASLDAAFGLDATEDAPARAANAALAIQKAAARNADSSASSGLRIALHTSRCSVGLGQERPWLDQESLRETDDTLGTLLASTNAGNISLSSQVAPLLARRFNLRSTDGGGSPERRHRSTRERGS